MSRILVWLVVGFVAYLWLSRAKEKMRRVAASPSKSGSDESPHDVLGVPIDADELTIRRAYQDKIKQYHPDRLHQAAPELQRIAEQRTKQLNEAYEILKRRS